jgi:hypothetical protein
MPLRFGISSLVSAVEKVNTMMMPVTLPVFREASLDDTEAKPDCRTQTHPVCHVMQWTYDASPLTITG